ncbi:response regulator [Algoriphagus terrigena]|uniref:response regulator n=1 Tax=Algoriphagus terrigena TaxID=344884 RepID=UPI00041E7F23|nr:response regulator [Algoriphagus terrigena]
MTDSNPKILIIDDDPGVLFLHKIIVKEGNLGSKPMTFPDAGEALEAILPLDTPDSRILIFLDINMPKMDGWEFLIQLSSQVRHADIKVVMVTSSLSRTERERSKEFGVVIDFWEKPMEDTQVTVLKEKLGGWLLDSSSNEV